MEPWMIQALQTGSVATVLGVMWWLERKERLSLTALLQQAYKDNLEAFIKSEQTMKDLASALTPRRRP